MPALSVRVNAPIRRLSLTLISGKTRRPSGTMTMPILTMASGAAPSIRFPAKCTVPLRSRRRPVMARRIELLPAPLAPISATVSPSPTSIDTPFNA